MSKRNGIWCPRCSVSVLRASGYATKLETSVTLKCRKCKFSWVIVLDNKSVLMQLPTEGI